MLMQRLAEENRISILDWYVYKSSAPDSSQTATRDILGIGHIFNIEEEIH